MEGAKATYENVAREAGCSASLVGHLVTGFRTNPSLDTVAKIAAAFEVEPAWLATGTGRGPSVSHLRDVAARRHLSRRRPARTARAA